MAAPKPRVYDAEDIAQNYRKTFMAKPLRGEKELPFTWPREMQHVGDSLAVAYASDKIDPARPNKHVRDGEQILYKHIAESRNKVLCRPELLVTHRRPHAAVPVIGPMVDLAEAPMPRHFAVLGLFEEADIRLHTEGTVDKPGFGRGKDDGIIMVRLRHAYVGGSKVLWSKVGKRKDQPFLVVYTESAGPLILIFGDELDIERDGIVG